MYSIVCADQKASKTSRYARWSSVSFKIARRRVISLLLSVTAFLACRCPALARESTDVIVMKNGDHITGQVKRLNGAILQVDLDYVDGTLSVDWLKVARIESKGLFLIQLHDGSVYSGKVITPETVAGSPAKIEIQPGDGQKPLVVDMSAVVTMTQTSESFLQRFSGEITLGSSYSKGNSALQYTFGSELDYIRTRWGERLSYESTLASNAGAQTSTRNQLDLTAYRLLRRNNYFYAGLAGFLQSAVQGIQRQSSVGGGMGVFLRNTNRVRFAVLGGLGLQKTNYTVESSGAQPRQNVGVALF
jgi:hypothetical protein